MNIPTFPRGLCDTPNPALPLASTLRLRCQCFALICSLIAEMWLVWVAPWTATALTATFIGTATYVGNGTIPAFGLSLPSGAEDACGILPDGVSVGETFAPRGVDGSGFASWWFPPVAKREQVWSLSPTRLRMAVGRCRRPLRWSRCLVTRAGASTDGRCLVASGANNTCTIITKTVVKAPFWSRMNCFNSLRCSPEAPPSKYLDTVVSKECLCYLVS